jgi:hypothetical protein
MESVDMTEGQSDAQESWWEKLAQDAFIDIEADAKMSCLGDDEADDMDEAIIDRIIQEDDDDTD